MILSTIRRFSLICVAAAMVLSTPSESQAICSWLRKICPFRYRQPVYQQPVYQQPIYPQPVYQQPIYQQPVYQPTYSAPACNPCATPVHDPCATPAYNPCGVTVRRPRVCQYVPQTCYRTQYVNIPVTSYRPVSPVGGCNSCQSTAYRPVTNYRMQAWQVPYTTYRIVYQQPAFAATPTYYSAPAAVYGTTTGVPASMIPPSLPASSAATGIQNSSAGVPPAYGTQKPATSPNTSGTPSKSNGKDETSPADRSNDSQNDDQPRIHSGSNSGPQLGAPDNNTEKTAVRSLVYRAVSASVAPKDKRTAAGQDKKLDDTGWRPSNR